MLENALLTLKNQVKIGYPIFADLPTYLYPIISDFQKPTYLPTQTSDILSGWPLNYEERVL